MTGEMILCLYLIIGFIVTIYDWYKYQEPIYNRLKKINLIQDNMVVLYLMTVWILWPIRLCYIFIKGK